MTILNGVSRRQFITAVAAATGSALLPEKLRAGPPQDPVLNTLQREGQEVSHERVPWKVRPFPMKQVRLGDGPCKGCHGSQPEVSAFPVTGGHYVGGHYLSACALMFGGSIRWLGKAGLRTAYASTGDEGLKTVRPALILKVCKSRSTVLAFAAATRGRLRS